MVSLGSTSCLPLLLSELFCLDGDGAVAQSRRSGLQGDVASVQVRVPNLLPQR